jgi:Transcription factor WhiB
MMRVATQQPLCIEYAPEVFFPDPSNTAAIEFAQSVCQLCPLREPCAAGAARRGERYGVWGGVEREQAYVAQRRAQRHKAAA